MKDLLSILKTLHRPRLLIRAARAGALDYRRDPHLSRILGPGALPRTASALMRLMDMEAALDAQRTAQDAAYSISRHVEVLVAMMGEARLLAANHAET